VFKLIKTKRPNHRVKDLGSWFCAFCLVRPMKEGLTAPKQRPGTSPLLKNP